MTLQEFLAKLQSDNPAYPEVSRYMRYVDENWRFEIERKERNLPELVTKMLSRGIHPVVDKLLKVVIGMSHGSHEILRATLCAYHLKRPGLVWGRMEIQRDLATEYIENAYGYYFSRVAPNTIIVGTSYRLDHLDKDLFQSMEQLDPLDY